MVLPNNDPSLPSGAAPIFADTDAARGDQLRANNGLIWSNLTYLLGLITNIVSTILGGRSAGNASGNIAVNNGTKNIDLNADKLDDLHAGNASGNISVNTPNVVNDDLLANAVSIGDYTGEHPITDLFGSLPNGLSRINVVYNDAADQYPDTEPQNYIFEVDVSVISTQKTGVYTAKLVNNATDHREWVAKYIVISGGSESYSGWTKTRNADGSVPEADKLKSSYHNVLATKTVGTSYTNTFTYNITIQIHAYITSTAQGRLTVTINSELWGYTIPAGSVGNEVTFTAVITPGSTYQVGLGANSLLDRWYEIY